MKKTVGGCIVVGALVLSGPVWAQASPPTTPATGSATETETVRSPYALRFEFGGRTGYGLVFGKADAAASIPIKRVSPGQIPLWFDAGARFAGHYFVGAYGSYGFGILSDASSKACDADRQATSLDISCHVHDVRLGLEFLYHPVVGADFDPWLGLSSGWEWFGFDETASAGLQSASIGLGANGPEYVTAQTGFDYWMSSNVTAGLFLAFSVASDLAASASCDAADCATDNVSMPIDHKAIHDWLFFGARMTFTN